MLDRSHQQWTVTDLLAFEEKIAQEKKPIRSNIPVSEQEQKAVDLRKSGLLLREVSKKMNITHQRVWQLLRAYCDKTGDMSVMTLRAKRSDEERIQIRKARHLRAVSAYAKRYPERVKARRKAWEEKNKENRRQYNQNWKANNKEKHQETYVQWFSTPSKRMMTLATSRFACAKRDGIEYDRSAFQKFIDCPPELCEFCKKELNYSAGVGKLNDGPSIDRVNASKGYIEGNIAVLCNKCNGMKGNATADEHRRFADFIENFGCKS